MAADYAELASKERIDKTIAALKENGMNAVVVETAAEAKTKALELLPEGSEVFTVQSETLHKTGLYEAIDDSGKYKSVRNELNKLDRAKDGDKMRKLGSAPDYVIGSVHAITEDGHAFIGSFSGSQLAADVSGAGHVVWVVGAQKLVKDFDEAMDRLYSYTLPLESKRLQGVFGIDSFVAKLLVMNRETNPERIHIILVKENLGF